MSSCTFLTGMGTVRGGIPGDACFPSLCQRSLWEHRQGRKLQEKVCFQSNAFKNLHGIS